MSTSEVRQLAIKAARGILPYASGCKQAAMRHALAEYNEEYRRLVGHERYLEVRQEYLTKLYQSLGLRYMGVDESGEVETAPDGVAEVEALKSRIRESHAELKKQRDTAARQQRHLLSSIATIERQIKNLPPFWFNALLILIVGGIFAGILFAASSGPLWPAMFTFGGLSLGLFVGISDWLKMRRKVAGLEARAAILQKEANQEAEKVEQADQLLMRKQAEFDVLCELLSRSLDLSQFAPLPPQETPEPTPEANPPVAPAS